MDPKFNSAHEEGRVAKTIEEETANLPSDIFLWSAIGVMGASLVLQLARKKHISLFVGQWVAPLLLFGVYNKLVKLQGHDRVDKGGINKSYNQSASSPNFSAMS